MTSIVDDIYDILFIACVAFLVGFKISWWMSRKHLDRMKKIWVSRQPPRVQG